MVQIRKKFKFGGTLFPSIESVKINLESDVSSRTGEGTWHARARGIDTGKKGEQGKGDQGGCCNNTRCEILKQVLVLFSLSAVCRLSGLLFLQTPWDIVD